MTENPLPQPSTPEAGPRTFTPYVKLWCMLAAMSLVYLGVLAAQPSHLGSGAHTAEAGDDLNEAVAEVRTLRSTLDMFRNELIEMRAQVSNQTDVTSDLISRVATIESAPGTQQSTADAATVINNTNDGDGSEPAAPAAGNQTRTAAVPAPVRKSARVAAREQRGVETGSLSSPATRAGSDITFGPPVVKQTAKDQGPPPGTRNMIGVEIATGPSVDSLRLSWTLLSERHADSFRALQPRYAATGEGPNQSYSLIVGPMPTADEARRLCEDLSLKATPCRVSQFTGDALL